MKRLSSIRFCRAALLLAILALPIKVTTVVGRAQVKAVPQASYVQLHGSTDLVSYSDSPSWRFTKRGWTDMSKLDRPEPIRLERRIELVHPLIFAACVILVAFGLLIWASEEWQWARVLGQENDH